MRQGPWHQFGDRSQKLALEQLSDGFGVGVIISPRDLARHKAIEYVEKYNEVGADILIDHQFYIPHFVNQKLESYGICEFRTEVSTLHKLSDQKVSKLAKELEKNVRELGVCAVLAPAITYEAGRPDITAINARLFMIAKDVAEQVGIPVYSTVVLGRSITTAKSSIDKILSDVTSLDPDGWYFAFEFDHDRIPNDIGDIIRFLEAGLLLACTGKPVMHAFSGPMSLLSFSFGATATAVGHSQNLWSFRPERWKPSDTQGGGGNAPPRFFSKSLWGTIVQPDETLRLSESLRHDVLTCTPFSEQLLINPGLAWNRWDANKHLVRILTEKANEMVKLGSVRNSADRALRVLDNSTKLYKKIHDEGISVADNSDNYQKVWFDALTTTLKDREEDYDYLDMII